VIVATGPVPPLAKELLGEIVVAGPGELDELLLEAEVLIARGGTIVTAAAIESAPHLRVIGRSGVGFSEVDVAAATRRGIPVVLAPTGGAQAVAEGALALVLALAKRLPELDRAVKGGRFAERERADVRDLDGAMLGILGYGQIGRRLAALAAPLGMHVQFSDPYVDGGVDLETLFAASDAVAIHAPLTEQTRGIVDGGLLSRARPGLLLVNVARGALVRSLDDLFAALETGRLGGVGLDVFEPEPPDPSHPLFAHPRVICTPHALWRTPRAVEGIFREMSEGILAALRGEQPAGVANPELYAGGNRRPPPVSPPSHIFPPR
jgi:D-3-phosphoglycerate dehydrogenase / 2-oxoglutarate reductase